MIWSYRQLGLDRLMFRRIAWVPHEKCDFTGEISQREDRTNTLAGSFKFQRHTGHTTSSFQEQQDLLALHPAAGTA